MFKSWLIAQREYAAAVRTKSFLITLILMPVLALSGIIAQKFLANRGDVSDRKFAIIDRSPGQTIVTMLEAAVQTRNERDVLEPETGRQIKSRFVLERVAPSTAAPAAIRQQRIELSERVKKGELFGFLDIGAGVLETPTKGAPPTPPAAAGADFAGPVNVPDEVSVRYHTNSPTYDAFATWAKETINRFVHGKRFAAVGIDEKLVRSVERPVIVVTRTLVKADESSEGEDRREKKVRASIAFGPIMAALLYMILMVGTTPMMQGVIEEKMQKIAEVLLGSVSPFQLMLGKLFGMCGVALTLVAVYVGGGYYVASRYELTADLPLGLFAWFGVYLIMAVFMYGSIFLAIGSAVNDMREAQSMLMPVILVVMLPMLMIRAIVEDPNSALSTWASFFPPATPMIMLMRQAIPPGCPWWHPYLGIVTTALATIACTWAAGRIFRIGILAQGKTPNFLQLARWVAQG